MMTREADDNSVISQPKCEIDKALSGGEEGECRNPGEVRYRGALLCEAHATLLNCRTGRKRCSIVCSGWTSGWMRTEEDRNGSMSADEEFMGRVQHERDEALGGLRLIREQIRSARKALG